jgi:hypothetical protein
MAFVGARSHAAAQRWLEATQRQNWLDSHLESSLVGACGEILVFLSTHASFADKLRRQVLYDEQSGQGSIGCLV